MSEPRNRFASEMVGSADNARLWSRAGVFMLVPTAVLSAAGTTFWDSGSVSTAWRGVLVASFWAAVAAAAAVLALNTAGGLQAAAERAAADVGARHLELQAAGAAGEFYQGRAPAPEAAGAQGKGSSVDTAERNYLGGDCQKLAMAIEPLGGFGVRIADFGGEHLAAVLDDGRFLDARGVQTREQMTAIWRDEVEIFASAHETGWLGLDLERCDYDAAMRVLADAGLRDDLVEARYESETRDFDDDGNL